jgi:hypothetical protein
VRPGPGTGRPARYGAAPDGKGGQAVHLRPMHGMLSAAIVIGVFAVVAAACLYVAVRVFAAGGRRDDAS